MTIDAADIAEAEKAAPDTDANAYGPTFVKSWMDAIDAACKLDKAEWLDDADAACQAYVGKDTSKHPTVSVPKRFYVFHSNIETIVPAVYNSTPTPDVRRRYGDKDEAARFVTDIAERCLNYLVDQYDFDATMRAAVYDAAIAGRGVVRVRYDGEYTDDPEPVAVREGVTCEFVPFRRFAHGPAATWADVPWVAFLHYLPRPEVEKLSPGLAGKIKYDRSTGLDGTDDESEADTFAAHKRAKVWEIWDKRNARVVFLSPDYADEAIKVEDDPYGLEGFFPVPQPAYALQKPGTLFPLPPFAVYRELLEELDDVTARIAKLVRQLRPRGAYFGDADDLSLWAAAEDGEIVPVGAGSAMLATGTNTPAIAWFPLAETANTLSQLIAYRDVLKATIYEATGISDILRGDSKASETATAQ